MLKQLKHLTLYSLICATAIGCTEGEDAVEEAKNTPPQIFLKGSEEMTISVNEPFIDPGVIAADLEDGNLTDLVLVSGGDIDTSKEGTYQLIYQVSDSKNLSAQVVVRTVHVKGTDIGEPEPVDPIDPIDPETNVPGIENLTVVAFSDAGYVDFMPLADNSVIDLSKAPSSALNIVATSEDEVNTGSLHFSLEGPVEIDRPENNPIYTMAVEGENLDLATNGLPAGDYKLSVTPYSEPDNGGEKGNTLVVNFSVVEGTSTGPDEHAPTIAAIDLVTTDDARGLLIPSTRMADGAVIDLNLLHSDLYNFVAVPLDESNVSSVDFQLKRQGSSEFIVNRSENDPEYTVESTLQNFSVSEGSLDTGDYTLTITPYAEDSLGGTAGTPYVLEFSVIGYKVPTIFAENDRYSMETGSILETTPSDAVHVNDTFDSGLAIFSVVQAPQNGSVEMDITGLFVYEPAVDFSGTDQFVYEVRQGDEVTQAIATIDVSSSNSGNSGTPDNLSSEGFTAFTPSADSKVIYVSSSSGRDTNDCLSPATPCKNINAAIEKMRSGYPDHLYLMTGDTWHNQGLNALPSGRSNKEPAVVAYYGDSNVRPRLNNENSPLSVHGRSLANVQIMGIHFSAYKKDPENSAFTGKTENNADFKLLGAHQNILFEDNKFDYMEIVVQGWQEGNPKNISFRRNIWTGAYHNESSYNQNKRPSNLYASHVDGLLLEENVIDNGGWNPTVRGASANMYNHNVYLQYSNTGSKVVVRNNLITRGSSHGIQMRSGGVAENNFFARNAVGLMMGYWDAVNSPLGHAVDNVISEGMSMHKGVNPCEGGGLCSPAVWGLEFSAMWGADWLGKGNIVSMRGAETTDQVDSFYEIGIHTHKDFASSVKLEENVVWNWGNGTEEKAPSYPEPNRTLGSYYKEVINPGYTGTTAFEDCMELMLDRPLRTWNPDLSAPAVNDYIRAGFDLNQ